MTDTKRTQAEILALLADNTTAQISPQDLRDSVVSARANQGLAWAYYKDIEFTSEANSDLFAADTRKQLTNDGVLRTVETQMDNMIRPWSSDTVNVELHDLYDIRVTFKAETTASGAGNYFDIELDIAGAQDVIWASTSIMAKGADIEHSFSYNLSVFAGSDFVTNGGKFYITSRTPMALKVWACDVLINRTYKADN